MYQKTIVVGHPGRDPEMRYTPAGVPVTDFSSPPPAAGPTPTANTQEKTTWFKVTCWRKLAELTAQYVKKGKPRSSWRATSKPPPSPDRDGEARATLELTATNVKFLGGRRDGDDDSEDDEANVPGDRR